MAKAVPVGIGHNNGPPMATRWGLHSWKRAHAEAWKNPGPEIVRLRLRRAAELGLTYKQLTSILMEVGSTPVAALFDLAGTLVAVERGAISVDANGRALLLPGVADKLRTLVRPTVLVIADHGDAGSIEAVDAIVGQVRDAAGGRVDGWRVRPDPSRPDLAAAPAVVLDLLAAHGVPPKKVFMVGDSERDRECAARARVSAFLTAAAYFDNRTAGTSQ